MPQVYYPPGAFYFELTILGSPKAPWPRTEIDGSFQEILGIDRDLEVQAVPEGGENRFAHQLPKRLAAARLKAAGTFRFAPASGSATRIAPSSSCSNPGS